MDFDTVHSDHLGQYSNPNIENLYTHRTDDHQGFSSLSHQLQLNNLDHNNPSIEGSSWNNSKSSFTSYSHFYDPFDPFQACFAKPSNQESYLSSCELPFAQEYVEQNLHVQSKIYSDNIISNVDHSRGPFAMMEQYQICEGLDYSEKMSSRFSDKGSFLMIVDEDDGNPNTNVAEPKSKRKRTIDNKSEIIKGQWTPEEDGLLVELVEKHGVRKWSSIAQMLPGRIGKQCRERWHNHLKPNIKKDRWSEEEDRILIEAHRQVGNRWAEIARSLPGRSENTIKNHWNATKRRQISGRRNSTSNNSSSPLQNYIKSVISSSQKGGEGNTDNSSSSGSTPLKDENKLVNVAEGEDEERLKVMLPNCSLVETQMHMQFDSQREMDFHFMEMLSYGYI